MASSFRSSLPLMYPAARSCGREKEGENQGGIQGGLSAGKSGSCSHCAPSRQVLWWVGGCLCVDVWVGLGGVGVEEINASPGRMLAAWSIAWKAEGNPLPKHDQTGPQHSYMYCSLRQV